MVWQSLLNINKINLKTFHYYEGYKHKIQRITLVCELTNIQIIHLITYNILSCLNREVKNANRKLFGKIKFDEMERDYLIRAMIDVQVGVHDTSHHGMWDKIFDNVYFRCDPEASVSFL